jgi:hypothetical protein
MRKSAVIKKISVHIFSLILLLQLASCKDSESSTPEPEPEVQKQVYLPEKIWNIPDANDYDNENSEYSHKRKVESENIVIFWAKEFGSDPMANSDAAKRFDVNQAIKELERFYEYYRDELKLVEKGSSLTDKYKMVLFVFGGNDQTAYGGGAEDIGILWTPAVRMSRAPYGALAHELGHSFQYIAGRDSGKTFRSSIMEMSAQYMLWHAYPEWMTFENYHLVSFMDKTHFAFLHQTNMYHSPYVIEYWSHKHGLDFFGKLMRSPEQGEDPVMTYKRITSVTQEVFNDEIFDSARKFITWDMDRIRTVAAPYANQHKSKLESAGDGWYKIAFEKCIQYYGYNGIKLKVPAGGTSVTLDFEGIAGAEGYRNLKTEMAGWRYGFVAHKKDGTRVYSDMQKDQKGTATITVPADTEYLWLVVSGAPKEHAAVSGNDNSNPQLPYKIKLAGTTLDPEFIK